LAVVVVAPARAESLARHLKDEYQNKNWFIADFYGADHLHYDSNGQILGGLAPSLWMTDGYVEVTGVDISDGHLRITAQRLLLHDNDGNGLLFQRTKRKLVIEADLDPQHKTPRDLDELWAKIFIMRAQRFVDLVPDFWKPCVSAALTGSGGETYKACRFARGYTGPAIDATLPTNLPVELEDDSGPITVEGYGLVYRLGKSNKEIAPPKAIYEPGPEFSEAARKAQEHGEVDLEIIVDKSGHVGNIRIIRPLGYGLDEEFVKVVKMWRFEPGKKDGKAVSVKVPVSVQFNLY
jgi:TonB family protein